MKTTPWRLGLPASLFPLMLLTGVGCNTEQKDKPKPEQTKVALAQVTEKTVHDHSGWWCDEHGVPEAECSMCSGKVAAEFKKKGDWCDLHDRAKSQCFICDPSLAAKYAARYEAKYGKQPPPREDDTAQLDGKK